VTFIRLSIPSNCPVCIGLAARHAGVATQPTAGLHALPTITTINTPEQNAQAWGIRSICGASPTGLIETMEKPAHKGRKTLLPRIRTPVCQMCLCAQTSSNKSAFLFLRFPGLSEEPFSNASH
jgi:hypothetical protein